MPANCPKNFYTPAQLARLFGRGRTAIVFAAKRGHLGPARIVGRRKYYSLAVAEAHYGRPMTAAQRQTHAARLDSGPQRLTAFLTKLCPVIRGLRDCEWRDRLAAQGIENFKGPGETP